VIALVVLLGLLIAGDRVAVAVAETEAAKTFQRSEDLNTKPSVRIGGFPFLTQLAAGTLDRVDATASDLVLGRNGRTVRLAKVTLHLHRLHISRSFKSARAETVTAAALVSYADLSQTLGVAVSYAGPTSDGRGRVKAAKSVTVYGQQISGQVSAEVSISSDNVLSFVSPQVTVGGAAVPPAVAGQLETVFGAPISLERLPFGLRYRSVIASSAGVTINLEGKDLIYTGS
jgi:hypothetical protein